MAKLIEEIIVGRKKYKRYLFKKENLIAGSCPECLHPVTFYEEDRTLRCTQKDCFFIANEEGIMIYSTEMKKKGIKKPLEITTDKINL